MATDGARRLLAAVVMVLAAVLLAPPAAVVAIGASSAVPTLRPVPVTEPWWLRVGFAGRRVAEVHANGEHIAVTLGARRGTQASDDGGRTWHAVAAAPTDAVGAASRWQVRGRRVGEVDARGAFRADPAAPAHVTPRLVAAPASLPGVVVAVDRDGVVWRRGADGGWARALLLLPQHLGLGPPALTAVVAFERQPLSDAVYLGSDGYAVLESTNGGDDWVRAGPGLPDHVLGLAADDDAHSIFAATDDGLWVHHLRATPSPPSYADAALRWRWLGIALITVVAVAVAVGTMLRVGTR